MYFRFLVMAAALSSPTLANTPPQGAPTTTAQATVAEPVAAPEKLSVDAFANLPFVEHAHISPDGSHIAGLFGVKGEQKIVIMPLAADKSTTMAAPVPDGTQASAIRWVNDNNIIVTLTGLLPVEGERWYVSRLVGINRTTNILTKLLWDLGGQNTADVLWIPSDGSNEILIAAQNSIYSSLPEFWPTVYRVDVTTGKRKREVVGKTNVLDWGADQNGHVRIGLGYDDTRLTSRLLYRSSGSGLFKLVEKASYRKDEVLTVPFQFLPGGDQGLVLQDNESGQTGIVKVDLMTQQAVETVFQPEKGEVQSVMMSQDGSTMLGTYTSDKNDAVVWFDPVLAKMQGDFHKAVPNSTVSIESMSKDRTKMLVRIDSADAPGGIYYFDTADGVLRKIASVNEKIGSKRLSPVKLVQYKARDGLEIEGVLTIPRGKEAKNLPFVVMPHGGPWGHDSLQYDYWVQFLASRGYAVLQPNFRGSTGYGTEFLNKGKGQMGFAMQDDVTDGVGWAIEQGIADPKRVCIVGASYGGYAAMWGIAKDPDLYRCAISISGVAAVRREVNDFGNSIRGKLYKTQWQEMTPDFAAVSPINAVNRMKAPLLLVHGRKDVTVDHVQSEKMNSAMVKAGKNVEFVSIPLADHYFTRQEDRVTLLSAMERFLAKHNPAD
ncbi:MAG: prolyl oligopeptidase family serine peptidase [Sphingorhabdus sp.]